MTVDDATGLIGATTSATVAYSEWYGEYLKMA
jgi:hypothetical protein